MTGATSSRDTTVRHLRAYHDLLIEARGLQERLPRASLRLVGAAAAIALIAVLVRSRSSVTGNLRQLSHPSPVLLGVAVSFEALSILAYALMTRQLLGRGGLPTRTRPLLRMTLAGIAMSASLPGGTAASTLYWFRELRHEGAGRSRAALVMAEGMALGIISLLALLVLGVAVAGASGPLAAARNPDSRRYRSGLGRRRFFPALGQTSAPPSLRTSSFSTADRRTRPLTRRERRHTRASRTHKLGS
jgi:uncharacterized membrane protein YbhN (UPF0104 family)